MVKFLVVEVCVRMLKGKNSVWICSAMLLALLLAGCKPKTAAAPQGMQALPVKVENVALQPVPVSSEYVATIKGRRSATIQPQVDGNLTHIYVKSGDHVKAGQVLMEIDPLKQRAAVDSQKSTQAQKKALFDYNTIELDRQKQLYQEGVVSRDAYDQALQAYQNSKADFESNGALTVTQEQQLSYYRLTAPFEGIVGDIPAHVGDYVSPSTVLTTVDQMDDLEAYIYVPTDRSSDIKMGLPVQIVSNTGELLQETKLDFVSPQVDNGLQGILVKAPVTSGNGKFRTQQIVRARLIWSTQPAATVPVIAVTRLNGQAFVFVATAGGNGYTAQQKQIQLGDTMGNDYVVKSGLSPGDKVIISGTQFLVSGAPVQPLG